MLDLNKKEETKKSAFAQIFLDKEARLSKKSWHYLLLKFTLSESMIPKYNFCPYFWLTIFCILVSPIVLPLKGLVLGVAFVLNYIVDFIYATYKNNIIIPYKKRYAKKLEDCMDNIFFGWLTYNNDIFRTISDEYTGDYYFKENKTYLLTDSEFSQTGPVSKYQELFEKWKEVTPDWREKIEKWKIERELNFEKRAAYFKNIQEKIKIKEAALEKHRLLREQSDLKRQVKMKNLMIKLGKYFSFLLIIPIVFVLYYVGIAIIYISKFLYKLLSYASHIHIDWELTGKVALFCCVGTFIGFILIYIIKFLYTSIRESLNKRECVSMESKCKKKDSTLLNIIYSISKAIVFPFIKTYQLFNYSCNGMVEGIRFFVIFIKNWKSDNCPEIIWDDEETKNKK